MSTHRVLGLGIGLSLLVHAVVAVTIRVAGLAPAPMGVDEDTDIELAPEAPEAHLPQPGSEEPEPPAGGEVTPEPEPEPKVATVDPEPPGTVEDEPEVAETSTDAGVVAMADAGADGDAAMLAQADAGAGDAGTEVAMGDAGAGGDAGAVATSDPPGPDGDGTGVAPSNEPDPYDGKPPPGAASNLLSYFPGGEKVTLLIRLDRFRGTMWSRRLDKILQPMPDYTALVGKRKMVLADEFDSITISSPRPRDATATTVMVRHRRTPAQMRVFLGKGGAPVVWKATRGGALGTRGASPTLSEGDTRVFLLPFPRYALLVRPSLFGTLTAPAPVPLDAFPADADLPAWARRAKGIEEESGAKSGPAAVITLGGLPKNLKVPQLGKIPGPERITISMEIVKGGVLMRGNLLFADEARAQAFVDQSLKWQKFFADSWNGKLMLATVHGNNAVKGLTMKRAGRQVGYATSISVADFQYMTDYTAKLTSIYFKDMTEAAAAAKAAGGKPGPAAPRDGKPPASPTPAPAPGGPSGPPN